MKTSELIGKALDYAVALAIGRQCFCSGDSWPGNSVVNNLIDSGETVVILGLSGRLTIEGGYAKPMDWKPSTDWGQGGPLIEEYKIAVDFDQKNHLWCAELLDGHTVECGLVVLQAAMRALVAHKLGSEVDIPKEVSSK